MELINKELSVSDRFKLKTRGDERDLRVKSIHRFMDGSIDIKGYTLKRFLDIVLGVSAFFVFCISFPFFAIAIKLSSKGPVLFKQPRTGQGGEPFFCYKFRTMHLVDLKREDGKPVVTQKGDKRIFAFGHILRKTNLDELPQIINVIKGEMSLVGPRPYPVEECKHWNNTFDDFYYRYMVKPGITGYAQVTG